MTSPVLPACSQRRRGSGVLLVVAVLLAGCVTTDPPRGRLAVTGVPSVYTGSRSTAGRGPPVAIPVPVAAMGWANASAEPPVDAFQRAQEASGLEQGARHPAGAALSLEQARQLRERLARMPVTRRNFAPRRVLFWLLREVLAGGEWVEYPDLKWRAERFGWLVLVRPDGYLVTALTGTPLQRLGSPRLVEGVWTVGSLAVGDFYFSSGGVFYPVNAALRRGEGPPLGELGLGRDPFNAALDGTQDALGEMGAALAQTVGHPIRAVEDLARLPRSVALLIASSPEYFARYGAMSGEDQIREAARLSTHVLVMLGGTETAVGGMGGMGADASALSLTAGGELVLGRTAMAEGMTATVGLGALSVLHMAGQGPTNKGNPGPRSGSSSTPSPGQWTYKTPTTRSEQALEYQEQITGRPAWYVYMIDEVEFDGFNGKELLEAKGPSYKKFLQKSGEAKPWFADGGGSKALVEQAKSQLRIAKALNVPLVWNVAEAEFVEFLRRLFKNNNLSSIEVRHTPPMR